MAAGASEWRAAAREAVARAMQTQPQGEAAIEAVLAALAPLQAETDAARKEAQDMGAALLEAHSQLKRATVKVERLEGLCRELQKKNKTLGDQHERVVQQEEAHRKLSASIADISQRVEAAQTERARQEAENTKLRESLEHMLKLNEAQQKHEASQNKARELQIQLLEAKLAQQKELAELEAKRAAALQRQFEQVTQTAAAQQHKLSEYDSKFSALQEDMQRANGLFAKYQAEMERVREALQRAESDKLAAEKLALQAQRKLEETQLAALAALEERGKVIERLQRDRDQLSKLCKLFAERGKAEKEEQRQAELVESLQQELRRQAAAATPAAPEPAPAPAPAPVLVPAPQ